MTKRWWVSLFAAAAVTGMTAGCHSKDNSTAGGQRIHGEQFRPDEEPRAVDNVAFAQSASGARADSTLYGSHFDTHGLNSLGRAKLALMLRDEAPIDPLVVYLDLPTYMPAEPAHTSVADYLKSRGLTDAQIELVDGANPRTIHSAAQTSNSMRSLSSIGAQGSGGAAPAGGAPSPEPTAAPAPAPADTTPHY